MPIVVQPPPVAPSLVDGPTTATLSDSGIVFGDRDLDAYGVRWKWNPSNAFGSKPAPREVTGDRSNRHGQWDGTKFYGARTREITGTARARSHADIHAAEQRLRDTVGVTLIPIYITEPGFTGVMWARQSGEIMWSETTHSRGYAHASFTFNLYAPDPLIYAIEDETFTLALPQTIGGATWPRTWPARWGANVTLGVATVTNPLKEPRPLRARLDGPIVAAAISNPVTGESLHLENPDDVPLLAAGEFLTFDAENHQVKLMGTASRRSWAWGDWPVIPPGDSQIALTGTGDPAARLTGAFTPARL